MSLGIMVNAQVPAGGGAVAASPASPTPPAPAKPDPQAIALQTCLDKCDVNSVNCKAACVKVPAPSELHVDRTTTCMNGCDPSNPEAYSACQVSCINTNFVSGVNAVSIPGGKASSSTVNAAANSTDPSSAPPKAPAGATSGAMQEGRRADLAMGVMFATVAWLML
ncbi:hypothetical protein BJ684DRAFT_16295 [Piptocephalis cylindrospora]|uniref:Uncharacterized protein n=1 Tax=Piptocephalis cylindrospora TaxID=1907219 RepID=A0A4P9Y533_9FUNG|nr:hypothetical protein BJ684DRAFT_16295 [Piptocephalis cylindrospora]|eukprot:RKP13291.1 hypothetical protein BJ684DRAFT_16295 [Piptocephalis cylindrospora]